VRVEGKRHFAGGLEVCDGFNLVAGGQNDRVAAALGTILLRGVADVFEIAGVVVEMARVCVPVGIGIGEERHYVDD